MGSRNGRDNGAVGNTETRDAVDGETGVDDAALLAGHHSSRAARVHERLDDGVLDVLDEGVVRGDIGTGGDLNGAKLLPGVGGVKTSEVVDVGGHDLEVNGVSSGGVVDDGSSIVVRRIQHDAATAEGLEEEGGSRAGVEGHLEDGVLGVLESLGEDLKLRKVALLNGLGGAGGKVLEGGAVPDLGADVGDDLLPLGSDVLEGNVGGAVTHGESVRATGGALAELCDGLGSVGGVVGDHGLVGERSIVRPGEGGTTVVLEVLADTRKVLDDLNALGLEVVGRGDTAALEDLGSVDGTSGQDDLTLGADGLDVTTGNGAELDSGGCLVVFVDYETRDLVLDEEVKVGEGVGNPGVVTNTGVGSLDGLRVLGRGNPADAMLITIVAGDRGLETELLVRLPPNALDGPLEGRERGLNRVAGVVGGIPSVAILLDELVAGLGKEEGLMGLLEGRSMLRRGICTKTGKGQNSLSQMRAQSSPSPSCEGCRRTQGCQVSPTRRSRTWNHDPRIDR